MPNPKSSDINSQPTQPYKPEDYYRLPLVCLNGRPSPETLPNNKQMWGGSKKVVTAFVTKKPSSNFIKADLEYLPPQFMSSSPPNTALVICITENMKSKLLESCPYSIAGTDKPFKLNRYRSELEIQLYESKTGKQLAKTTFAREANPCIQVYIPSSSSKGNSEDRFVEAPNNEFRQDIETWLKTYIQ
ncbi:hypothetical protein [Tumidithrix helvetica]|uniref:hypothetical protein n=1 Tax=Tumidithrix helvetica TaxID=3457545 RepID=UPI003CC63CCB